MGYNGYNYEVNNDYQYALLVLSKEASHHAYSEIYARDGTTTFLDIFSLGDQFCFIVGRVLCHKLSTK